MEEAKTACVQLGYSKTVGFETDLTGGPATYLVDDLDCQPNHARLHDCYHLPWLQHNCGSNGEKVGVTCQGGSKFFPSSCDREAWNKVDCISREI